MYKKKDSIFFCDLQYCHKQHMLVYMCHVCIIENILMTSFFEINFKLRPLWCPSHSPSHFIVFPPFFVICGNGRSTRVDNGYYEFKIAPRIWVKTVADQFWISHSCLVRYPIVYILSLLHFLLNEYLFISNN